MARSQLLDHLQCYAFWLMDLGPNDSFGLPILSPWFGFSEITAPELTLETQEIMEGNWYFNRKVIKRGNWGNITLNRGLTWYDSDFWRWTLAAISGDMTDLSSLPFLGMIPGPPLESGPTFRRTLMLIQYFPHMALFADLDDPAQATAIHAAHTASTVGLAALATAGMPGIDPWGLGILSIAGGAAFQLAVGPFEIAARVPARIFVLKDCIPIRYKTGTDMDATSSAVHIAELELAVELVEELSVSA